MDNDASLLELPDRVARTGAPGVTRQKGGVSGVRRTWRPQTRWSVVRAYANDVPRTLLDTLPTGQTVTGLLETRLDRLPTPPMALVRPNQAQLLRSSHTSSSSLRGASTIEVSRPRTPVTRFSGSHGAHWPIPSWEGSPFRAKALHAR